MTISRQDLENREIIKKQEFVAALPQQLTDKQLSEVRDMNEKLSSEANDTKVMRARSLEHYTLDEVKTQYQERYESKLRQRDLNASDRQIRERAESKTGTAMKLHKKLQNLCGSLKGFKDVVNLNYTVQLIGSYNPGQHKKLDKDDTKKLGTLKKKAPEIYERFLKLEHVNSLLNGKQNEFPEFCDFARQELERAKSEWERAKELASELVVAKSFDDVELEEEPEEKNVKKINPKISKTKEKNQLANYKSLHNKYIDYQKMRSMKAGKEKDELEDRYQKNKINDAHLDQEYIMELRDNLKKKTVDWSIVEDKKFNDLKKKVSKDNYDPADAMNYILAYEMRKILAAHKGVTPQEVEKTVNEYLKKMVQKSEFHARIKGSIATAILDTRYRGGNSTAYSELIEKQFSANSTLKPSQCISFGSLGAKNAKGILGPKPGTDPVRGYGNVTIRLNKKKMKGRVSFVCGNSKGMVVGAEGGLKQGCQLDYYDIKHARSAYIDEKNGHEPDITACGLNLSKIYERARELENNNWNGLEDGGREASKTIVDRQDGIYFECQYHGNVSAAEIDEVSYILNTSKQLDLSKMSENDKIDELAKSETFREMYDHINIINKNAEIYGRKGMKDMKLTVWDMFGHTMSFEEVKALMEKKIKK